MKNFFTTLLAVLICCTGCRAAATESKTVSLTETFTSLSVSSNIEVYYTPGAATSLKISAPADVLPSVTVTIKGGTLCLGATNVNNATIKATLTAPALSSLTTSGNAEIKVDKPLNPSAGLVVDLSGNSEIKLASVNTGSISIKATGNAEFKLGTAEIDKCAITSEGAAEVTIKQVSGNALAIIAGGNAEADCKRVSVSELGVLTQGNAEVTLEGRTNRIGLNASGSSEIDSYALGANIGEAVASGNAIVKCHVGNLNHNVSGNAHIKNR